LSVGSGDFTWVGWVAGVDREGIVEHDTVDGVLFCIRLHAGCMCLTCCTGILWQRICVGLGGLVWDDCVSESGFPAY